MQNTLYIIAIWAVPVLLAITLHEAAHGWAADKLGDSTARRLGRISLNPFRHIDPLGTVVIPLMALLTFGFAIGAAKPVPVNTANFKQPYLDMALVALAGPVSNFIMAIFWAMLIAISLSLGPEVSYARTLHNVGQAGVAINVIIMAINMLPIPPLDGSKVVAGVLPASLVDRYIRFERYGFIVLLGLVVAEVVFKIPIFSTILYTLVKPFMFVLEALFNFKGICF